MSVSRRALAFLLAFTVFATTSMAQQAADPRVGRKIMITKHAAELKTPQSTVWKAYLGEVFTVTLTNGEWLWINEKGGWLWEKETVPFDTAIDELSKRVVAAGTAENYQLRGVAFLAHQQYDKAIKDFSECLRQSPRNVGAMNNRGQALYLQGNYDAAIRDFTAATALEPKNFLVLNNRALAYIEQEQYPLALSDLQAALKLVPEYPEALNNRGIVNQKMNRTNEAIADFTGALKIDPKYVDALGNRAYSHRQKKDYTKAIADLEAAMKISPTTFEATNDLAWLLATCPDDSIRNPVRALELAKLACGITEYKQWNTLDTYAAALAENGQYDEAKKWVATAKELAPEKEKARIERHMALLGEQKPIRE